MPNPKEVSPPPNPTETLGLAPGVLAKRKLLKSSKYVCEKSPSDLEFDGCCDRLNPKTITYRKILKAASIIKGNIEQTPMVKSRGSTKLYYKLENYHRTGSFHERTAFYCLSRLKDRLKDDPKQAGVITASMGNWAMALAYHGCRMKIPVTVVLPLQTIMRCVEYCEDNGARVILFGKNFAEAKRQAFVILAETGAFYINSYDHPHAIAAAGTIGLEILEQLPDTDAIIIPIGGGGLIAGITTAAKELKPNILIYGVEPDKCCCFFKAMENEYPYETAAVADGVASSLAISKAGYNAFHTARSYIDKMVLVNETRIVRAMLHILENDMMVAEGAGAASLSALLAEPDALPELRGKKVVCVISGGNVNAATLPHCIERAKAAEGRLIKITVNISSRYPDVRARVLKIIGNVGCFVRDCLTQRNWYSEDLEDDRMSLVCETRDLSHACTLKRVLDRLFPKVCEFLEDPFSAIPICACFPRRII